jgi:hypothetical protein
MRLLVQSFCEGIWDGSELATADALLTDDFVFHDSCERAIAGRAPFVEYVRRARRRVERRYALLDCVCEADRAFARVRVSCAPFAGDGATGPAQRVGAAWFRCERHTIDVEWMLGDLGGADPFFHFVRSRIAEVWVSQELTAGWSDRRSSAS